jgi:hypothetical protein
MKVCASCAYWTGDREVLGTAPPWAVSILVETSTAECRWGPPSSKGWPLTQARDWCGRWELCEDAKAKQTFQG